MLCNLSVGYLTKHFYSVICSLSNSHDLNINSRAGLSALESFHDSFCLAKLLDSYCHQRHMNDNERRAISRQLNEDHMHYT